ncbi:site-specific integrase [Candidatus Saccharibacteria bacterium]|nr:site-specific integrase [Candidatus Saccharibacteria bacterium]
MKSRFHAIKRKNGLYEARYWARFPDGTKKQRSLYDRDLANLKKRYLEASAKAVMGQSEKRGGETTAVFLLGWLKSVKGIKESTRWSYEMIIRKHILPRIGHKPISEIDLRAFQKLVDDIVADGNSARTATLVKWILSKAQRRARILGLSSYYIDSKDIEIPQHIPEEREIWSLEELKKFLEIMKGDRYEWLYLLYITYGLRRGEAIPIKWEDIDWIGGKLVIDKQYTKVKREYVIETPKTKNSIRELPLLPHIREYLENVNPLHNRTGLIALEDGRIPNPETVSRHFQSLAKNNGLPCVVLHSLRHCVATFLKDAGVSVRDSAAILGHSSPMTTLKYYQHTNIDEARDGLSKYSNLMGF